MTAIHYPTFARPTCPRSQLEKDIAGLSDQTLARMASDLGYCRAEPDEATLVLAEITRRKAAR